MTPADYFFLVFLVTIAISRVALAVTTRLKSPTVRGFRFHHYMYGLSLIIVSLFTKNLFLYAVGIALVFDEAFIFLFSAHNWRWKDNYSKRVYFSKWSFIDLICAILLTFIFRSYLVGLI